MSQREEFLNAVIMGKSDKVKQMLSGETPDDILNALTVYLEYGDREMVVFLLEGGNLTEKTLHSDSECLFRAACRGGHLNLINEIQNLVPNIQFKGNGFNFLTAATYSGVLEAVKYIVERYGENHDYINLLPAMQNVGRSGNIELFRYMIRTFREHAIRHVTGTLGKSIENGQIDLTKYILDSYYLWSKTVLDYFERACYIRQQKNRVEMVKLLLNYFREKNWNDKRAFAKALSIASKQKIGEDLTPVIQLLKDWLKN